MKKLLMLVSVLSMLVTTAFSQIAREVDPVVLAGKTWRSGLAVELYRDSKNPQVSLNALTVTDLEKRSFDTFFAYRDRTVHTGFGIGYDIFSNEKVRVKAILGYTGNMTDFSRLRDGEWGLGVAIRFRL